jgi:hypothetical protein
MGRLRPLSQPLLFLASGAIALNLRRQIRRKEIMLTPVIVPA